MFASHMLDAIELSCCQILLIFLIIFPPSEMQLEQEILNFSEGLRVIGVKPAEKLALFADNSCRWLVVDQGR